MTALSELSLFLYVSSNHKSSLVSDSLKWKTGRFELHLPRWSSKCISRAAVRSLLGEKLILCLLDVILSFCFIHKHIGSIWPTKQRRCICFISDIAKDKCTFGMCLICLYHPNIPQCSFNQSWWKAVYVLQINERQKQCWCNANVFGSTQTLSAAALSLLLRRTRCGEWMNVVHDKVNYIKNK